MCPTSCLRIANETRFGEQVARKNVSWAQHRGIVMNRCEQKGREKSIYFVPKIS